MAVGATQIYDAGLARLLNDAEAQWDSSSTFQFALLLTGYTPADTHSTWADVSANVCTDGDYDEILVTSRTVSDTGSTIYIDSADADLGASVTISARYLVCVQTASAVAGTLAGTDKLIWYKDLNTGGGNLSSTSSTFKITAPANGWLSFNQA